MINIHLQSEIIPPGTKFTNNSTPKELITEYADLSWMQEALGFFLPETGEAISNRSVAHDIIEDSDGENIPELKIVGGVATTTIFAICAAHDRNDFCHGWRHQGSWACEYMQEGEWEDIREALPEIYKAVWETLPNISLELGKKIPYPIQFLTVWDVQSSRDWESGITEIDKFTFRGLGKTMKLNNPELIAIIQNLLPAAEAGLNPSIPTLGEDGSKLAAYKKAIMAAKAALPKKEQNLIPKI